MFWEAMLILESVFGATGWQYINVDYDYQHALTRLKDGNLSHRIVIMHFFSCQYITETAQ